MARTTPGKAAPGGAQAARFTGPLGEDAVVVPAELLERELGADLGSEAELHPCVLQLGDAAGDDGLVQLEVRDPVDEQPPRPVLAVIDRGRNPGLAQSRSGGKASRARAHDGYAPPLL